MAKSRHRSLRTLQRYARPGPDAVAALTAAHDPRAAQHVSDSHRERFKARKEAGPEVVEDGDAW